MTTPESPKRIPLSSIESVTFYRTKTGSWDYRTTSTSEGSFTKVNRYRLYECLLSFLSFEGVIKAHLFRLEDDDLMVMARILDGTIRGIDRASAHLFRTAYNKNHK